MVNWTEPARNDLKAIFEYIALDSKFYARNTVRNIVHCTKKLEFAPDIGRIVPEVNDSDVREVLIYSYRIIYQKMPKGIFILAVVHGHRNIHQDDIPVIV